MPRRQWAQTTRRVVVVSVLICAAAACGGDGTPVAAPGDETTTVSRRAPTTLRVPDDHATIQGAVDASVPGDLVLIDPGTYREAVEVRTERLVIRGLDRNKVVLDGGHELGNGITVNADGVAVENLTVRNYRFNGVLFFPDSDDDAVLEGYRASYVTAYNNGLYGLYAFGARGGVFEDSYASGHPDSGFYIGRCDPCDAVVRRVVAEGNVVGFQGTNASTNLFIVESTWQRNRIGIQPNSDTAEGEAPQHDAVIVGNRVLDNDNPETPPSESGDFGYGIALGGPSNDIVERNLVVGNANTGIALLGENDGFVASGNRVRGNVLRENGVDLEYITRTGDLNGNCFEGNTFASSFPSSIEGVMACGTSGVVSTSVTSQEVAVPPGTSHRQLPAPPAQPSMPDAATAPARPATGMPDIDPERIVVPEL